MNPNYLEDSLNRKICPLKEVKPNTKDKAFLLFLHLH